MQSSYEIQDDALERVRANGYWAVRVRSAQWTMIGYFQFFVSGVMALFGIIVLLRGLFTPQDAEALSGMAWLSPWGEYAVALVCFVIAYRMALNGFTTFLQRDELLMRIDVAMNTALMATQITTLTQHMTSQQKNHK